MSDRNTRSRLSPGVALCTTVHTPCDQGCTPHVLLARITDREGWQRITSTKWVNGGSHWFGVLPGEIDPLPRPMVIDSNSVWKIHDAG